MDQRQLSDEEIIDLALRTTGQRNNPGLVGICTIWRYFLSKVIVVYRGKKLNINNLFFLPQLSYFMYLSSNFF